MKKLIITAIAAMTIATGANAVPYDNYQKHIGEDTYENCIETYIYENFFKDTGNEFEEYWRISESMNKRKDSINRKIKVCMMLNDKYFTLTGEFDETFYLEESLRIGVMGLSLPFVEVTRLNEEAAE